MKSKKSNQISVDILIYHKACEHLSRIISIALDVQMLTVEEYYDSQVQRLQVLGQLELFLETEAPFTLYRFHTKTE